MQASCSHPLESYEASQAGAISWRKNFFVALRLQYFDGFLQAHISWSCSLWIYPAGAGIWGWRRYSYHVPLVQGYYLESWPSLGRKIQGRNVNQACSLIYTNPGNHKCLSINHSTLESALKVATFHDPDNQNIVVWIPRMILFDPSVIQYQKHLNPVNGITAGVFNGQLLSCLIW